MGKPSITRRGLLGGSAAGLAALPARSHAAPDATAAAPGQPAQPGPGQPVRPAPGQVETLDITLQVNGRRVPLRVEPRTPLLDALREQAGLTGTKKGCARGSCGACTVHIDGRRVLSCLTLAARSQGKAITTIEGLAQGGELHPMQAAFIEHDAYQCGYCTPGQIMSAVACVDEGHAHEDGSVREWMSGNICRCGAYPNIVAAIRDVAGREG